MSMVDCSAVRERFEKMEHPLAVLMLIGLAIRLIIAPFFTFNIDMGYWAEVIDVFQNGFGLYGTAGYYYTPIWGYYLGFISFTMQLFGITDYGVFIPELASLVNSDFCVSAFVTSIQFNFLVKFPLILVDAVTGWLIYLIVIRSNGSRNKALLAFALWFFCPIVITESTFHGTFDNMSVMMLLVSIVLVMDGKYTIAGAAFSAAILTKFFPMFMVFFLVAYVLRKEGLDTKGVICVLKAIAGAAGAFVLIYLPNIIRGDFWQSLYFIAYRLGITRETLASIGVGTTVVLILMFVAIIGLIAFAVARYGERFREHMLSMDERERNLKVAKVLGKTALAVIILMGIVLLIRSITGPVTLESGGSEVVLLVCIFSIFLEIYLAFRLLMLDEMDDRRVLTIMFLSGIGIIIWACAASYTVVMIPFMCIYAGMVDQRFLRPYIVFSILYGISEITAFMLSPTSMIIYILGMDISVILPVFRLLADPMLFGFSGAAVITIFFGVGSYLSLIYISYKWYREYYERWKS